MSTSAKKKRDPLVKPGIYRHYKNNEYEVIDCARHTETGEELVVYRNLSGQQNLWVRPKSMFTEYIEMDGIITPRFLYVRDSR